MKRAQRIIAVLCFLLFICITIFFVPEGFKPAMLRCLTLGGMAGVTFYAAKDWRA